MLQPYFRSLYKRTMREAYGLAFDSISEALRTGGQGLDCGASTGGSYERLKGMIDLDPARYAGIEWSKRLVEQSVSKGLNVIQGDLNRALPFDDGQFRCVFGPTGVTDRGPDRWQVSHGGIRKLTGVLQGET